MRRVHCVFITRVCDVRYSFCGRETGGREMRVRFVPVTPAVIPILYNISVVTGIYELFFATENSYDKVDNPKYLDDVRRT